MPRLALISPGRRLGVTQSSAVALPQGVSRGTFVIPRNGWAARPGSGRDAEVIDCDIEISFDSGQNWQHFAGFSAVGGDLFDRRGDLGVESLIRIGLPNPESTTRMIRASLNCKESLNVRLDLDAE
jgi:hypothetical protein